MKKLMILGLMQLLLAAPAGAHTNPNATAVTWEATPCAVACAYWLDNGFTPCRNPFPPGSYDDVVTSPAPTPTDPAKIMVLQATIDPVVDWDLFVCVGSPLTEAGCHCTYVWPDPCYIGCHEDVQPPDPPRRTDDAARLQLVRRVPGPRLLLVHGYLGLPKPPPVIRGTGLLDSGQTFS